MNRNVNDFLEEFSDNFSELFIETFLIRYLSEFKRDEFAKNIGLLKNKLNIKIDLKFKKILLDLGVND